MCLYPRVLKNKRYVPNKKNKGVVPIIKDKRQSNVRIGCGKCIECKKKKANEWRVRLNEELKHNKNIKYVTLTLSNESWKKLYDDVDTKNLSAYEIENEIITLAERRFLERWRKSEKKSVRHWFISELGGENYEKIHLHGFIWTKKDNNFIREKWKYGHIWFADENDGYVNEKTINYITKYLTKTDQKHKYYNSKILCSAGIGKGFMARSDKYRNRYQGKKTDLSYKTTAGIKLALPDYFKKKLYTDEEREKLWSFAMDKAESTAYIFGKEFDKKEHEKYLSNLEEARRENTIKGFGGEINFIELREEEIKRRYIQNSIINKKRYKPKNYYSDSSMYRNNVDVPTADINELNEKKLW